MQHCMMLFTKIEPNNDNYCLKGVKMVQF